MKLDFHGIRFRIWFWFFLFTIAAVTILGVLLFSLIRPYYRNNKITTVKQISEQIEEKLIDQNGDSKSAENVFQIAVENNVCVTIYNQDGRLVYSADSLGSGCIFNLAKSSYTDGSYLVETLEQQDEEDGLEYSSTLVNEKTNQNMVLYGKKISKNLVNLYVFINSPLEPVDSIIEFFSSQYVFFTLIILAVASGLSLLISSTLTKPIVKMNEEAKKLAGANYDVAFVGGNYTETKQLATTLNGAAKKLNQVDEMRKDLIANVSHDIKTPLTSIKAYAEMVRDISYNQPDKREEHLNVIISEADYLDKLVVDMSQLSQLQSGVYVLKCTNFDLSNVIEKVVGLNQVMIEEGQLHIEITAPEHLTVYGDETKITQVIQNFLSNAIKHTPEGKSIFIRAKLLENEETIRFEIQDEGEGIDEKEIQLIWNRYQKTSRSFSRSLSSTGLGLSIVKAILDIHKARYGVQSKKGEGSLFWFELDEPRDTEST